MKPVHERNQECLPPKKRDLPVNNNNNNTSINNNNSSEDAPSSQSSGATQPSMHYGMDGGEGLVGLPVDQFSMLYKVALPAGTYSPTSLHPVLSHISPAYTVPSQVLQHTSVPYPPLCYAQIPHSSLQFVSSPYAAAVPYAVPPGFVPSPLIPPQSAISQPHSVSHLVPYPSVIQEGVASPQQQVSTHAYTKMGVPLVLPSDQTVTQAQLGTVGMLPAGELSPRAVQQVVGRLASPVHGTSRKEAAHVPLNLSQSFQRGRETQGEVRTPYASNPAESRAQQQQFLQQGHRAVAELPPQQGQQPSQHLPAPGTFPQAPLLAPSGPSHFMKGAIIQLATGELKRVEDLQTQDFVRSAEVSGGLKIDSSMVVDIRASQQRLGLVALHFNVGEQQSKVTIDVPPEHPFFVFGQGWSSCSPERTAQLYGLTCHHLQVGDVCVSVTLQQQAASQQKPPQQRIHRERDRDKEEPMQVGGASQRRWSAPGFQRYSIKNEEGSLASAATSGSSRPSFIPQEVKLSIEGRSNAGK
uniref:AXH domain-containing protein n=1 Tax=Sinocyclocheilus anshuiensis TaxID=1608454 RepID=A0A671LVI1_9TELE